MSAPLLVARKRGIDQFGVENATNPADADWESQYVSFSGFAGIHAPETFAAAPELLDALETLLDASERHIFGDECLAERDAARAAIAKAKGDA